ncbi:hypothetical protein CMUS01_01254 [Colletotrichum musicola]|uniref:RRM domain-containing protein n=1 Tax=Colletotrichum musicola TaxID=2175873 RepID=A0A8H6NX73_9PEZI|nr:hypothetical protein CMUS01_01254 [Colletotrichum musicola]
MAGKVDQKKTRDFGLQGRGFKFSDLPRTVIEDAEDDNEPGGARLDGALLSAKSGDQAKVSSDLNPNSSPWVPNSNVIQATSKVETNEGRQFPNGGIISQMSSPQLATLPIQNSYGSSATMCGLQFVPGHCTGPAGATSKATTDASQNSMTVSKQIESVQNRVATIGQQLSFSASTGNLPQQTPVRHVNGVSLQYSGTGNGAAVCEGVASPGSATPKASHNGLRTEPRNFAPRSIGNVADLGAPPKFSLNNGSKAHSVASADPNDPFVAPTTQGGPVQIPVFGSQVHATHVLNGNIPVGLSTSETLGLNNLPNGNQLTNVTGVEDQSSVGNGGQIQPISSNAVANFAPQQGVTHHYLGQNSNTAAYQATYAPSNAVVYAPSNAIVPYVTPVPDFIRAQRSLELNHLTAGPIGLPTAAVAMHQANFPFVEPANRSGNFVVRGVVKIGNIPFVTNRAEIIAVLGRNSRILNDTEEPVHIIMERVTGKTTDAYVEFHTFEDATKAVEKFQQNLGRGRVTRIGQRPVEIELSSQSALMKDLFPSARGVFWNGCNPQILPNNDEEPWDNFKGFVSNEEMTMLVKHVEVPHRSPFSKECPQRPFECLISTLTKFPWHMKTHITIQQRHAMHKATCDLLRILVGSIRDHRDEVNLTQRLLKRVVAAAMRCEGFSAVQKDDVAYIVDMGEMEQRAFGQPRFADCWRHLYVLVPKTGVPLDVIEWYIAVIRDETNRFLETQSFQEKCQTRGVGDATDGYFGFLWRELNHPVGPAFDSMTLSQLAMCEYQTMESIIRRALSTAIAH